MQIVEKSNGTTTSTKRFLWCGSGLSEERDAAGTTVLKRFYAEGVQVGGVSYFYMRDHLGSIRELTDSAGGIRARYEYDPYGRPTKVEGNMDSDFGFTGHYFHAPSKLHLALYRAYDSETGRWLNRDPIGEAGGINLYGYVFNDPVNSIDRFGLFTYLVFDTEGYGSLGRNWGHVGIITTEPEGGLFTRLDYNHGVPFVQESMDLSKLLKSSDDSVFIIPDQDGSDWRANEALLEFVEDNKGNSSGGSYNNNCVTSTQRILKNASIPYPTALVTAPNSWAKELANTGLYPYILTPNASQETFKYSPKWGSANR